MLPILILVVIFLVGVVLILSFGLWLGESLTGKLVSEQFQAAEFILEHHQAPEKWARGKRQAPAKGQLLTRLDELIHYFEGCPFFADEEARTLLLAQLRIERDSWETKPLETLITGTDLRHLADHRQTD